MAEARCVLTDSGGIQEETTALGHSVPDAAGEHRAADHRDARDEPASWAPSPDAIYESWREVAEGEWPAGELPELWDGKAAGRIVRVLLGAAR